MGAVHHLEVCLHLAYLRVAPVFTVPGVSRHFNYSSVKTNMSNKVKVITQDTALCFCIVLPADSVSVPNTHLRLHSQREQSQLNCHEQLLLGDKARASSEEIRL